jgi:hypothetical protein
MNPVEDLPAVENLLDAHKAQDRLAGGFRRRVERARFAAFFDHTSTEVRT